MELAGATRTRFGYGKKSVKKKTQGTFSGTPVRERGGVGPEVR